MAQAWPDRQRLGALIRLARDRPSPTAKPTPCPELDCVRHLLPGRVLAAAEQRAQSIGLGADRVLICADAITEEAYLSALAASLGTSYEPLDRVSRADCPLDDHQLIQAAAAGLLPLRHSKEYGGEIVWIVAPRCLTARRFAGRPRPKWLRSFRFTSSERLFHFVAQHAQQPLGRRAADGLRQAEPLFSNAPRPGGTGRIGAIVLGLLAAAILAPAPMIEGCAILLCLVFLAAASFRLLSAAFSLPAPVRPSRLGDSALPVYSIICALYREANVVHNLVAAIRALDYPGIMAQTPQA